MAKALIGMNMNDTTVIVQRYDGDQSIEELKGVLPTYTGTVMIKTMIGEKTLDHINECYKGFHATTDPIARKRPKLAMQNIDDYTRLLHESVRAVKEDRMLKNIQEQKNAVHKKKFKNDFKEDDWRPDALFIVQPGKGDWAGRPIWRLWDDGDKAWVDIDPDVIMIKEHPEMAEGFFGKIHGKNTEKRKKKPTRGRKKANVDVLDEEIASEPIEATDDRELNEEDAAAAKMLDSLDEGFGYDYEE